MNAFKAYFLADQKQGAHVNLITEFVIFFKAPSYFSVS